MKKTFLFALAALALAISCQKNSDINDTPEVTPDPVMRTFTCTIADPNSKVAINDTNGKTTWEVGDEIFIHGKYFGPTYTKTVTLTSENISADGKTATFNVDLSNITPNNTSSYEREYFAAYPANVVGGYNNGDNMYYYNCFTDTNKPLMAAYQEGDSFKFFNICGVLSFVVDGDYDQISFTGNNNEDIFYTYYRVKIVPSEQNYKHTRNGASTTILQDVVADGSTINKIYFPNGAEFNNGFTINFIKESSVVKTLSTTKSVSIARNQYRPIGNVTSYLKDYVAPAEHASSITVPADNSDYDLSKTASANCYIVDGSVATNANKEFKFKAYKGKSTTNVGAIASVEILWETYNNAESVTKNSVIAAVDFDKKAANDYYEIVFKMPETLHAGNAVIAAKNAGGTILWSWHIWVPNGMFTTDTYGLGEKQMMSRNLGALVDAAGDSETNSDILSYGLMYQWGRKDPFPGSGANGSSTAAKTYPTSIITNTEGVAKDMDYAIQNPNVFISTTSYNYDWNTSTDGTLWGEESTKTIYDPCPVGYRVPNRAWASIYTTSGTSITGWALDKTHYWVKVGSPITVFPITGYIEEGGSLDHVTDRFILWNSRHDADYSVPTGLGYSMYFNSTNSSKSGIGKVRGGVIRCVKE